MGGLQAFVRSVGARKGLPACPSRAHGPASPQGAAAARARTPPRNEVCGKHSGNRGLSSPDGPVKAPAKITQLLDYEKISGKKTKTQNSRGSLNECFWSREMTVVH